MIYTVTFNPSLDYVVAMRELTLGRVNRTQREELYPGGKGINVSIVLKHLGFSSQALGFTAGFTGQEVERLLQSYGCNTDFIEIENGFTRINVKIKSEQESEINGQGPDIAPRHLEALFHKLDILERGDVLVLAGSIPSSLPEDIYERILQQLSDRGTLTAVDATGRLLVNVLKYRPFLIKPNNHELGEIFGEEPKNLRDIIVRARELQTMGGRNILVSMAGDGAVLLDETGRLYQSPAPRGTAVNSVGAGDSMVAGFLAGYLQTGDYEHAFRTGLCAGSASAFQEWLAEKEDVDRLMAEMEKTGTNQFPVE